MYYDAEEIMFRDNQKFLEHLRDIESNTIWRNIPLNELFVEHGTTSHDEADYDTCVRGTNLFACRQGELFTTGIRECAIRSLYDRLGLGGKILERLDAPALEELFTFAIKHSSEDELQVPVVDGKINAFLSSQYKALPAEKVFSELLEYLRKSFNQEEFKFNGYWTYFAQTGEFELPDKRMINGQEFDVVLVCKTSDAGYSGVNFSVYIKSGNLKLPIMSDIALMHKGDLNEDKLKEALNQLEKVIDNGVKKLNDLLKVYIENPKGCMKRIAKEVNLPKRDTLEYIENYEDRGITTAFDCYTTLARLLDDDNLTWSAKERLQGNLYRALGLSWQKFDLPGDFAW